MADAELQAKNNARLHMQIKFLLAQQSGAVEACWAHNPEVRGSKPRSANKFLCQF